MAIWQMLLGAQAAVLSPVLNCISLASCQIAYLCIGSEAIGEWLTLVGLPNLRGTAPCSRGSNKSQKRGATRARRVAVKKGATAETISES
jgi:hypothetical protein